MIIGSAREQEIGAWSKPWNKSGMKSGGKGAAAESLVTQLRKSQLIRIPREGQQDRRREADDGGGLGFPIGRKELGLVGQSIFKGPNFAAHLRRPSPRPRPRPSFRFHRYLYGVTRKPVHTHPSFPLSSLASLPR